MKWLYLFWWYLNFALISCTKSWLWCWSVINTAGLSIIVYYWQARATVSVCEITCVCVFVVCMCAGIWEYLSVCECECVRVPFHMSMRLYTCASAFSVRIIIIYNYNYYICVCDLTNRHTRVSCCGCCSMFMGEPFKINMFIFNFNNEIHKGDLFLLVFIHILVFFATFEPHTQN